MVAARVGDYFRHMRLTGRHMTSQTLQGLSILVVEDEPLIAMDIALAFEQSGAQLRNL